MNLLRKISLTIGLIFALILLVPSPALASCFKLTNGTCPPNFFTCGSGSIAYCCTESTTECGTGAGLQLTEIENAIGLGGNTALVKDYSSIGAVFSGFLPYILTGSGIVLLIMLVAGGFTMLSGASSPESQEKGKKQITFAIVGFIVIFAAFWIAQVMQIILKVDILGVQ